MEKSRGAEGKSYQIKLKGQLDRGWADWFDGMTITIDEEENTLLTGLVLDDSALHGVLKKIRDLGLALISVNIIESNDSNKIDEKQGGCDNED